MGQLVDRTEWMGKQVEDKDVLDVGCAWETMHFRIAESARSVMGIDINRQGVSRMQRLGYTVMTANAEDFVIRRRFDVVVLGACLEHMNNLGLVLDCARDNLRDGGRLVITTPNARYLGVAFKEMVGNEHRFIFTPKSISNLLKAYGFEINCVQFFRDEGRLNFTGWFYEKVFLRVFPQLAMKFGIVAEKSVRRGRK